MDYERFTELWNELIDQSAKVFSQKNADYADAGDVLANIKGAAQQLGLSPEQVALVYFHKHIQALTKGMLGQELQSESLEERFVDAENFLAILWALYWESREIPQDETF